MLRQLFSPIRPCKISRAYAVSAGTRKNENVRATGSKKAKSVKLPSTKESAAKKALAATSLPVSRATAKTTSVTPQAKAATFAQPSNTAGINHMPSSQHYPPAWDPDNPRWYDGDFRPPWLYTWVGIARYLTVPTVIIYGVFYHDFGDYEHIFQPPRRWVARQKAQFFELSEAEQNLLNRPVLRFGASYAPPEDIEMSEADLKLLGASGVDHNLVPGK